ncbi:MAG: ATP synthase F1 subunit epsilon [Bacilli bacterium]|nr:ATP synthase F1 subunit epsilon [Bacilli bacterium]
MEFRLQIITPYGIYFDKDIDFLNVPSSKGLLGILPKHAPLISDVLLGEIMVRDNDTEKYFATSGGLLKVNEDGVILLLDTVESEDQIDIDRATNSKKRAMDRLEKSKLDDKVDVARTQASLSRALNRLKVASRRNG